MAVKYTYASQAMVSSYKKETAYATLFPTKTALNYHTLQEADVVISYDDQVRQQGKGDGTEFGATPEAVSAFRPHLSRSIQPAFRRSVFVVLLGGCSSSRRPPVYSLSREESLSPVMKSKSGALIEALIASIKS